MQLRLRTLRGAAIVAAVALAASACGSSKKSDTSTPPASTAATTSGGTTTSATGGTAATGSPVTIMTIAPTGTAATNFPDVSTVLDAFASDLNAKGGVAGHVLKVEYCNDKNDPNEAAGCGRKAVSDKVMAVVGTFSTNADQIVAPLEAAGIPYIGSNAISAKEYSSPVSFPVQGGPIGFGAIAAAAGQACTKTDFVTYDLAAALGLQPFLTQALAATKKAVDKTIKIPVTATDFSSFVTAAKDADCIVVALPEQALDIYLAKAKSLGVKQKVFAPAGALGAESLKAFGPELEGSYTVSSFPSPDDPAFDGLKAALKAAGKSADLTVPENTNAWVAGVIFEQVAKTLTTFDSASLLTALKAASAIDTGGLTPTLNFTKGLPIPALAQIFDTSLIGFSVKDSKLVQQGTFVDYGAALRG